MDTNEYTLIKIGYLLPSKPGNDLGFQLDESLRVASMTRDSVLLYHFCVYDQVHFIDGIHPNTAVEAMELLGRFDIKIEVHVWRSKHIQIIPFERQQQIGLNRKKGYCYFLAILKKKYAITNLGLSLGECGTTPYVLKLDYHGIAGKVLQLGDFLMDVDSKIGLRRLWFKRHMVLRMNAYGSCSIVVARAEGQENRVMLMNKLHLKPPEIRLDPNMPLDAQQIAARQIEFYRNIKAGPPPKSILLPISKVSRVSKTPRKKRNDKVEETSDTATDKTTVTEDDDAPKTASPTPANNNSAVNNNADTVATTTNDDTVVTRTIAEEESDTEPRKVSWHSENIHHEIGTDAHGQLQKVPSRVSPTPSSSSSLNQSSRSQISSAVSPVTLSSASPKTSKKDNPRQTIARQKAVSPATSSSNRASPKPARQNYMPDADFQKSMNKFKQCLAEARKKDTREDTAYERLQKKYSRK